MKNTVFKKEAINNRFCRKLFYKIKDDCGGIDVVHQMGGASAEEYERVNVIQTLEKKTLWVYGEDSICNPEDEYGKRRTPIVYGYKITFWKNRSIGNLVIIQQKAGANSKKKIPSFHKRLYGSG